MAQRKAKIDRKTKETDITAEINLDGTGRYELESSVGFLDHMLAHLSKHSGIDIALRAKGDLEVDAHHTVEDAGICLGQCLDKALADKKGILRYGSSSVPMEDSLANVAIDLSGRSSFVFNAEFTCEKIGDFDVECVEEFLRSFAASGRFNLHVNVPYGTNSHHMAEAVFKALGQSLGLAVRVSGDQVASTKGVL